ncbi:MAG: F0F1 ATP synthase subunit epsilon [Amoebophilaceae bacterium]|jgi:F-type H+-transporting ATPase subunit epsilon|nr:F0F1 ATP synthase subunit epsilon [Amoebophilaceae bacterium]
MHLTIITPDEQLFKGSVKQVTFPGSAGSFQVFQDHAPLVSVLQKGTILYGDGHQEHALSIEEGLVEVSGNHITVLLSSAT